ncbi:MAG TPA: DNA polymerase III subunit delta [Firmicutes bacterium]|jgi:DNA polymerase-3 subunit delta|nr:DNA polymerase III subunit delta [Bacillota bacterium]HCX79336.1 DNA polymerase III subunit delta [Bacillota bacterium]
MAENYLIIGEEDYLVDAKVKELAHKSGGRDDWSLERLSGWIETREKLLDMPMFSGPRVFLLEYDALAQGKPEPKQAGELLACHENVLIIYTRNKLDKRSRLYKEISKNAKLIEVIAPKRHELTKWVVHRGTELGAAKFERGAADNLIFLAGTDMLVLDNELRKLINYSPEISIENVRKLAVRNLQTSIFELVDAVVGGQLAKALGAAEDMLRTGAEVPYVLYMLGRQYRLLFQFLFYRQQGYGSSEIQRLLPNMHPYAFQNLCAQATSLNLKECATSLHTILDADYAYKTGMQQGAGLLQILLIKLAKK